MNTTPALPRIERTDRNGLTCWIKRPERERRSIFYSLHRLIARHLPPLLKPTNSAGGMTALRQEAERLQMFAGAGFPVPEVLESADDHILLSDCGEQLRIVLDQADEDEKRRLIRRTSELLNRLFRAGLVHGRPHIRDFAVDEATEIISLLDLEEDPLSAMDLQAAIVRDAWLYLGSLSHVTDDSELLLAEAAVLFDGLPDTAVLAQEIRFLLRWLSLPYHLLRSERIRRPFARDVHQTWWGTWTLDQYLQRLNQQISAETAPE